MLQEMEADKQIAITHFLTHKHTIFYNTWRTYIH